MTTKTVQILLVEDDDVDAMAVGRAFRQRRIANPITVARDGIEALEILRGQGGRAALERPIVILLDLNMPRMNGLEFLEELRADPELEHTVVFVLTTSSADEDRARAHAASICGYIVKKDVSNGFLEMVEMLQAYWRVVELPE